RYRRRLYRELAFTATRHRPGRGAYSGGHQCHHRRSSVADNYPARSGITSTVGERACLFEKHGHDFIDYVSAFFSQCISNGTAKQVELTGLRITPRASCLLIIKCSLSKWPIGPLL